MPPTLGSSKFATSRSQRSTFSAGRLLSAVFRLEHPDAATARSRSTTSVGQVSGTWVLRPVQTQVGVLIFIMVDGGRKPPPARWTPTAARQCSRWVLMRPEITARTTRPGTSSASTRSRDAECLVNSSCSWPDCPFTLLQFADTLPIVACLPGTRFAAQVM